MSLEEYQEAYYDGMTASEWVSHGLRLASMGKAGKVSPELISGDNNYSTPPQKFSQFTLNMKTTDLSIPVIHDEKVLVYVQELENKAESYRLAALKINADKSLVADTLLQTNELLSRRPKDRRLAQVLCDWMNLHEEGGSQICKCELCRETKYKMNELGDPIIHTTDGWKCVGDVEEFKQRNVAAEFVDNTLKLANPSIETIGG